MNENVIFIFCLYWKQKGCFKSKSMLNVNVKFDRSEYEINFVCKNFGLLFIKCKNWLIIVLNKYNELYLLQIFFFILKIILGLKNRWYYCIYNDVYINVMSVYIWQLFY